MSDDRTIITFQTSTEEREAYQAAADAEDRTLSSWIRRALAEAIKGCACKPGCGRVAE